MNDAAFEKVSSTEKPLYGPRKLLLCGFSKSVQPNFDALLKLLGLTDIPKVWVTEEQANTLISKLIELEDGTGWGVSSELPRAVIMAGITQKELHQLMSGCRQAKMKPTLWATLTPTSENWTIQSLLTELAAEHRAMQERKQRQT